MNNDNYSDLIELAEKYSKIETPEAQTIAGAIYCLLSAITAGGDVLSLSLYMAIPLQNSIK